MMRQWLLPVAVFLMLGATLMCSGLARADASSGDPCGGNTRLLSTIDRPTAGFSTCAVKPGTVLLEEGYQNQTQAGDASMRLIQYPQGFERIGLAPRFELDIIGPNFNRQSAFGTFGKPVTTTGFSDAGFGFKYEFEPHGKGLAAIDVLYTAASGTNGFSAGSPTQIVNFDYAYALSSKVSLGTTIAVSSLSGQTMSGSTARFGAVAPSMVVTDQLSDHYQLYAEVVRQSKIAPDLGGRTFIDYGLQTLVAPRLEVDIELGQSLTAVQGSKFHYLGIGCGVEIGG